MVKLVVDSGRTGFYLSVLEEGITGKGDPFVLKERDPHGISIAFANRIYHHDKENCEGIRKVLDVPVLSESWRGSFEELLKRCS